MTQTSRMRQRRGAGPGRERPSRRGITAKLALTALFWGGTFIAARRVTAEMGPFTAAFLRFLVAGLALLAIGLGRFGRGLFAVPRAQRGPLALLGFTGIFLYNVFFFAGLHRIEAGRAAAIVAINPVVIALWSAAAGHERFTRRKAAGIALSVAGALTVIARGDFPSLWRGGLGAGEGLILGCVASWVAYSLVGRSVLAHVPPLKAVFWAVAAGDLLLMGPALAETLNGTAAARGAGAAPGAAAWLGILYLGLFGTVLGFVWFYQGVKALGAVRASQFINAVPVSAVALGVIVLREPLTGPLVLGTALVVAGVTLAHGAGS